MCGYEFTNKLARMFQDVKVSEDLCVKFFESLKSQSNSTNKNQTMTHLLGLDFNIYILQVTIILFSSVNFIFSFYYIGKLMACFSNSKYHLLYSTTIRKINSLSQLILYFPFKFIPRSIFSSSNYSIMNNTAEESYSGCTIYPPVYSMRFNCLRTVSFTCSRCANVSL